MGNECCQQQKLSVYQLDVSSNLKRQDFMDVQFPNDDQYLKRKVQQITLLQKKPTLKHITSNKYYWGQWEEGTPIGKGILYRPNVFFYQGNFEIKPNSYGKVQFIETGLIYEGQIKQGRAEGNGVLTHVKGLYHYDGAWKNSQPVTGTLTIKDSQDFSKKTIVQFNQFPVGQTRILYPDGRQYYGLINHRKLTPEGKGKVIYNDKSIYQGQWSQGYFHGQGVYEWKDGTYYQGSYQYGRKHGFGKYVYKNKNIYQGQWIESIQHGRGVLTDQKGNIIKKGIWHQGRFLTSDEI